MRGFISFVLAFALVFVAFTASADAGGVVLGFRAPVRNALALGFAPRVVVAPRAQFVAPHAAFVAPLRFNQFVAPQRFVAPLNFGHGFGVQQLNFGVGGYGVQQFNSGGCGAFLVR